MKSSEARMAKMAQEIVVPELSARRASPPAPPLRAEDPQESL
jgi:hypothetical protein